MRKTRFSRPGGPLTVTEVLLRALMKILLAAGVFYYFHISTRNPKGRAGEGNMPLLRECRPAPSGPGLGLHPGSHKPRYPACQSQRPLVPAAADSGILGRLKHQDGKQCEQPRRRQSEDLPGSATMRRPWWPASRCPIRPNSYWPRLHCTYRGFSHSSCRSTVSTPCLEVRCRWEAAVSTTYPIKVASSTAESSTPSMDPESWPRRNSG